MMGKMYIVARDQPTNSCIKDSSNISISNRHSQSNAGTTFIFVWLGVFALLSKHLFAIECYPRQKQPAIDGPQTFCADFYALCRSDQNSRH